MSELINAELLAQEYTVQRLAEICYFNKETSNQYIEYCAKQGSWSFRYSAPVNPEFTKTLDNTDKEFFIKLILDSESACKYVYEDLADCDYELSEVA